MPGYDQRFVRREGKGFKSISTTIKLCDSCGARASCSIAGSINKGEVCAVFEPVIPFPDKTGLDRRFNTFRKGMGSFRKLEEGQIVALYSKQHDGIIGQGVVRERATAPLGELLERHAAQNHLMLREQPSTAPGKLRKVLRRMYGNNYGADDKPFSVIYLERVRADR